MKARQPLNVSEVEEEYAYDNSIWNNDEQDIKIIKQLVSKLSDPERRLLICYAECGSLRKVSSLLGVGLTTTAQEIKIIQNKIKKQFYGNLESVDNNNDSGDNC